ncbi:hypothetical protein DSECCO2_397600 [anaerobic digester metagenome]
MVQCHQAGGEDDRHAVEVGGRCSHGDQGVHVGAAVSKSLVRADIELVPGDELHRRGQGEHDEVPPFHQEVMPEVGKVHDQHDDHGGHRQGQGEHQQRALSSGLPLPHLLFQVQGLGFQDLIAGVEHRLLDLGDPDPLRIIANGKLFRDQVDRGGEHTIQVRHRLLDCVDAGGAAHTPDGEGQLVHDHAIPGVLHRPAHLGHVDLLRVEGHRRSLRGKVDIGLQYALQLAQGIGDRARAGGAGHAGDRKRGALALGVGTLPLVCAHREFNQADGSKSFGQNYRSAMTSISTIAPLGSADTWMAVRAG